jgi:Myotubularin-like phosphatase domain
VCRDRTSQLSALSQILLDPYYRTIQGYLVLINKDWCACGHQFEDRIGKHGCFDEKGGGNKQSKEASPIFLQFLDVTWQLLRQFPTHFEFTAAFLSTISQAVYSGYFLTFRMNCERERFAYLSRAELTCDVGESSVPFSSLFTYLGILLRSPVYARLLLNPRYQPTSASPPSPSPSSSSSSSSSSPISSSTQPDPLRYIRPRYNVSDLEVWADGMLGFTPNAVATLGNGSVSEAESAAVMANTLSRYDDTPDIPHPLMSAYLRQPYEYL